MKKQLYRVKQLADQRVGRAEKTDLLTEDLQYVEKTVDKIKFACATTSKKLNLCMLSNGPDIERRKKKLSQLQLGQGMLECASVLGDSSVLGGVLLSAGETQSAIAGELTICETEIDTEVLAPFQKILETDIPNISLTKKKLSMARLDMDASKTRWLNAVKVSQGAKGNMVDAAAKADLLKSDVEDQTAMFQSLQNSLATEMFSFVAGEWNYAQCIVKLMKAQMDYHEASYDILKTALPILKKQMDDSMSRPVYGCPLDTHLCVTGREIAFVLEECVLFLLDCAMDMEGLFRIAGSATQIRKLKAAFDAGIVELEECAYEIHVVTGALKLYLRELPEPLLTFELFDEWIEVSQLKDRDQKLQRLWGLINKLPEVNRINLRYLVCFLAKLAENCEINKMSASNIAIVIGPNLLWSSEEGGISIAHTGHFSTILENLIEQAEWFFPEGCDFTHHHVSEAMGHRFNPKDTDFPSSPEMPSMGGGSLFSEVSKKLGWKEGQSDVTTSQDSCQIVQSYYNPLADQYDPEDGSTNVVSPWQHTCRNGGSSEEYSHKHTHSSSSTGPRRRLAPPLPAGPKPQTGTKPHMLLPKPKLRPPEIPDSPKTTAPDIPTTPKPKLSALSVWHNSNESSQKPDYY